VKRILLRSGKDPWVRLSPETTFSTNVYGGNSGNLLFSYASHRLLTRSDTQVVSRGLGLRGERPERVNEQFDHVVLPMANSFRRGFLRQLEILTALIEGLTVPVTILSIGMQAEVGEEARPHPGVDDAVRRFVSAVLDRSPSIGVRGELTADYLRRLGFRDVEVIGCPSMFLHGPDVRVEKRTETLDRTARVSFSVTPRVGEMAPVIGRHVGRFRNLRYVPQDHETLGLMLWGTALADFPEPSPLPFHPSHALFRDDRARFFVDPEPWIAYERTMDFAFGDRIHGNVAAVLAGTPALLLAHDTRTLELARHHGIPYRMVTDVAPHEDATHFYEQADYSAFNAGHPERWRHFESYLHRQGLQHSIDEPDQLERYDARVAAAALPGPVHAITRAPKKHPLDRTDWLYRELGRRGEQIDELRAANDELTQRLAALETRFTGSIARRASRLIRRQAAAPVAPRD